MTKGSVLIYSKVGKSLDKGIELALVNLPTSVLIKLIIALLEVLLIPGLNLIGCSHDVNDKFL